MSHHASIGNPGSGQQAGGLPTESTRDRPDARLGGLTGMRGARTGSSSGRAEGAKAPLGSNAKSDSASRTIERFALQAIARDLLPSERVCHCLRTRQRGAQNVEVWRSPEYRRAHYKRLQTCGSVWNCPVCAAKISERRRVELEASTAIHKATGGGLALLTLTNSHSRADRLSDLLNAQAVALKRFWNDRASRRLFERLGVIGLVRAVEVTWGKANGWHPHYHILLFLDSPRSAAQLTAIRLELAQRWIDCCKAAGLPLPDLEHGADIRGAEWAARYASKWGLEQEVTKGHIKKGRGDRATPWDLLRRAFSGDSHAGSLFQEFAQAFKGKRQLYWSAGLKDRFSIEEKSDEQLVEEVEDSAVLLGSLTANQWRCIVRAGIRAHLLIVAESGDWGEVMHFVEGAVAVHGDEVLPDRQQLPPGS